MSDVSGVDNLNSGSAGDVSLTGIKSAIDNLNAGKAETSVLSGYVQTTRQVAGHALSPDVTVAKSDVGLGNVDNTSDATKNSATAALTNKTISGASNTLTVREADLSLSASNTTNDVSTTKHGLVPTAPNNTTNFLRADATWATPTAAVFKNGYTTRDVSIASGVQNIAHGLGKVPIYVRIYAVWLQGAGSVVSSNGAYNGTTNSNSYFGSSGSAFTLAGGDTSNIINLQQGTSTSSVAVCTVDGTNIILTWSKQGSPTGNAQLMWEAIG